MAAKSAGECAAPSPFAAKANNDSRTLDHDTPGPAGVPMESTAGAGDPSNGKTRIRCSTTWRVRLSFAQDGRSTTLASLTGWPVEEIRRKAGGGERRTWWQKLYDD